MSTIFNHFIRPKTNTQTCEPFSKQAKRSLKGIIRQCLGCVLALILLLGSVSLAAEQGITLSTFRSPSSQAAKPITPQELLSRAIENFQNVNSYEFRLILHITKGPAEQNSQYHFYYQKPNLVRMYVDEGAGKGNTVILRKDGLIRGRREGALSMFPVTLKADDERLCDLWHRQFDESDWGRILGETLDRVKKSSSSTVEVVDSGKHFLLTVKESDGFLEQTWLDCKQLTLAKKLVCLQNGDKLDARWTDVSLNPQFDENFFYF